MNKEWTLIDPTEGTLSGVCEELKEITYYKGSYNITCKRQLSELEELADKVIRFNKCLCSNCKGSTPFLCETWDDIVNTSKNVLGLPT